MKIFVVLLGVAVANGSPYFEDNYPNSAEHGRFEEEDSGSFEGIALPAPSGWQSDALDFVNTLRARANLPPYAYNDTAASTAQTWADQVACIDAYHEDQNKFAENIAGLYTNLGETAMVKDGIQRWYDENKQYTCAPVTDSTSDYYLSVGHYMNLMSKSNHAVGFGMKICPQDTEKGNLVARFYSNSDLNWPMWNEQLRKQGMPEYNTNGIDDSAFVPCPSTFKAN